MSGLKVKDTMNKVPIQTPTLKKLKGEVSVQLFNAKTGELEQEVKGENIVTNAIRDIFAANNIGLTDYSTIMPLSQKLFGGILCFQNALTLDADNYYLPKTSVNPVVAHAGQTTYSSAAADSTRGNPNDSLSGTVTNGYKHVWTFDESQGNGTISALGLCPADLGDWWLNGGTNFFPFTRLDMWYKNAENLGRNRQRCPSLFDATNRRAFAFVVASSSVTIRELKDYGVIQDIGLNQNPVDTKVAPLDYEDHTFSISNAMKCYILYYQGNIHFLYASGTTITRTIVDTTSWTTTSDTLTVVNASLTSAYDYPAGNFTDIDADGYAYFLGSNSKFYKVSYPSCIDVIAIDRQDNDTAIAHTGGFACFGHYCHVSTSQYGSYYIIEGNTAHRCASSKASNPNAATNSSDYIVENYYNGTGTGMMKFNNDLVRTIGSCSNNQSDWYNGGGYSNAMSKLFLSTIKNLDTPVLKTSSQKMTITYTITEVDENE